MLAGCQGSFRVRSRRAWSVSEGQMKTCFARQRPNRGPLVEFGELVWSGLATSRPEDVLTGRSLSQQEFRALISLSAVSASGSFDATPLIASAKLGYPSLQQGTDFVADRALLGPLGCSLCSLACCWIVEQESHNYTKQRCRETDAVDTQTPRHWGIGRADASSGLRCASSTGYACRAIGEQSHCLEGRDGV